MGDNGALRPRSLFHPTVKFPFAHRAMLYGCRNAPNGLVLLLLLCRGDATDGTGHGEWVYAAADGSVPSQVIQAQTWDYKDCTHDRTQARTSLSRLELPRPAPICLVPPHASRG